MDTTMVAAVRHAAVVEVRGPSGRTFVLASKPCMTEDFARDLIELILGKIDGRARVLSVDVLPVAALPGHALEVVL